MADLLLHETAVSWLRAGLTATLPRSPETETAEDYYARLQEVCADANRRHNEPETQRSRQAFRLFASSKAPRVMPRSDTKARDDAFHTGSKYKLTRPAGPPGHFRWPPTIADFA